MSGVRRVRDLWRQGQRGWPARYPVAQLPNAPLAVALGSAVIAVRTDGAVRTGARATFHVASSVWAWKELTDGANVVRRIVGAGALASVAADVRRAAARH